MMHTQRGGMDIARRHNMPAAIRLRTDAAFIFKGAVQVAGVEEADAQGQRPQDHFTRLICRGRGLVGLVLACRKTD